MTYIDTKYLFQCETCRRLKNGQCDTWCENGECYSPNMSRIPTIDASSIFSDIERLCIDPFGNFNQQAFAELKQKYTQTKEK